MGLALSALLFVLAVSIKHNPIEFPLAVLLDLLLVAPRRALWFCACGMILLAASVGLHLHYGGPYFLDAMLAPSGVFASKTLSSSRLSNCPRCCCRSASSLYTGVSLAR